MYSLLLVIIYLAFISLGLPDSLLGSAWPAMSRELDVPLSYAGILSMIISAGTVVSGLFSDRLTRRFGAGKVTAVSVLLTAAALLGFSLSGSYPMLCVFAVPYGLGAGAIDAALNNYVALYYASRHMSWLHCFWGIGTMISPYIMSACLTGGLGWHSGYRTVSYLQFVLTVILFCSLPLWKKRTAQGESLSGGGNMAGAEAQGGKMPDGDISDMAVPSIGVSGESVPDIGVPDGDVPRGDVRKQTGRKALGLGGVLRIPHVKLALIVFFAYCALEATTGLWASSYLVTWRGTAPETAARLASFFYMGITFGRFLSGFLADRLGDRRLIRLGGGIALAGIAMIAVPLKADTLTLAGLIVVGLGCAPIYPSVIHATPANFGKENSQAVIGVQMASAYVGTTFMPPLFGLLAQHISIALYPAFLLVFAVLMLAVAEYMNRRLDEGRGERRRL